MSNGTNRTERAAKKSQQAAELHSSMVRREKPARLGAYLARYRPRSRSGLLALALTSTVGTSFLSLPV